MAGNTLNENLTTAEMARRKQNEYNRKWRRENPDKVKEYRRRYWARKYEKDMLKESGSCND